MDPIGPQVIDISMRRRYFLFLTACTHVLLASGEAYGWTALRPVLIDSGLFDGYQDHTQCYYCTSSAYEVKSTEC